MKFIAIIIGKILIVIGTIFHRGSTLPGKVALKIDKKLLSKLKYPENVIAITGSSGKGSTSKLIANTLKRTNASVTFNESGSNLDRGITSSLLKNCTLTGKIKTDYVVLEIDERYTKKAFCYLNPKYIVITNLTKDQPPRQHYIDIVYEDILNSIPKSSKIITNMDDPFMRNFSKDLPNEIIYYSILENKYSYKKQIFENLNIYRCPYCNTKLKYKYYNFETLGNYYCPNCDFKYEEPTYTASSIDLTSYYLTYNKDNYLIGGDMLYNAYNTMSAISTLKELNIPNKIIYKSINELNELNKLEFISSNKLFKPISCKAENATTYNQAIFKVINDTDIKDVIIGWKEISRRYNYYDVSWLYDVEFELLTKNTSKFYACGIDALNIKKRLILAGIPDTKIITCNSLEEIKDQVLNDNVKKVYGILNFDYIEPFKDTFKNINRKDFKDEN